jgi:hypothetical protein
MHQTDFDGESNELGTVAKPQLSIDSIEVGVDRLAREAQLSGDLPRRAAVRGQPEDLPLPLRQQVEGKALRARGVGGGQSLGDGR